VYLKVWDTLSRVTFHLALMLLQLPDEASPQTWITPTACVWRKDPVFAILPCHDHAWLKILTRLFAFGLTLSVLALLLRLFFVKPARFVCYQIVGRLIASIAVVRRLIFAAVERTRMGMLQQRFVEHVAVPREDRRRDVEEESDVPKRRRWTKKE